MYYHKVIKTRVAYLMLLVKGTSYKSNVDNIQKSRYSANIQKSRYSDNIQKSRCSDNIHNNSEEVFVSCGDQYHKTTKVPIEYFSFVVK